MRRRCVECGRPAHDRSRFCYPHRTENERRIRQIRREARKLLPIIMLEAAGICCLCGELVDPALPWPDDRCATVEHLTPIEAGGRNDLGNLGLAHYDCNRERRATLMPAAWAVTA